MIANHLGITKSSINPLLMQDQSEYPHNIPCYCNVIIGCMKCGMFYLYMDIKYGRIMQVNFNKPNVTMEIGGQPIKLKTMML